MPAFPIRGRRAFISLFGVPTIQFGHSDIMLDRTVIKTIFKHVLVGPAYHRTRFDAQQLHDLVTIEIRPDRVEILLFLKVPCVVASARVRRFRRS